MLHKKTKYRLWSTWLPTPRSYFHHSTHTPNLSRFVLLKLKIGIGQVKNKIIRNPYPGRFGDARGQRLAPTFKKIKHEYLFIADLATKIMKKCDNLTMYPKPFSKPLSCFSLTTETQKSLPSSSPPLPQRQLLAPRVLREGERAWR
jgi:hypothetical protein